ncbi:MAG: hypothetical protein KIH08_15045 [Candidatus Freyarchaeota archaeon]|nr:hypothetical protein [Candidatus Jordarchaeia archaeon]MBS7269169.1 hypothetical protein [Candidatus Jordarchaeia archaeon]MBS7279971.1 hypothetical protein [Candidatus Jordarchaeia archaeon]
MKILKVFKSQSENTVEAGDTQNTTSKPLDNKTNNDVTPIDSYLEKANLMEWLQERLETPEMIEASKNVEEITLQFNTGGNLFYMTKSGVQSLKIVSGRTSEPDALIRISPGVESKLASVSDFTEFFQEYKKYANLSGGEEYIKIKLFKDLSQLSKKGILRSKLIRTLLMA